MDTVNTLKSLLGDEKYLDLLILIENKEYLASTRLIRDNTYLDLMKSTIAIKDIARKEFGREIFKNLDHYDRNLI